MHEPYAKIAKNAKNWRITSNSGNHIYNRYIDEIQKGYDYTLIQLYCGAATMAYNGFLV